MNSILQIRIDKETKEKASKILSKYRVDLSTGIRLFLNNLIKEGKLSDELVTELYATEATDDENIKASKEDGLDISYQEIDFMIHLMHLQEKLKEENIDINKAINPQYLLLEKKIIEKIKKTK